MPTATLIELRFLCLLDCDPRYRPEGAYGSAQLVSMIQEASRARSQVIIDLDSIGKLHSQTLAALLQFTKHQRDQGRQVAFVLDKPQFKIVIEMLGLKDIMTIVPSIEAACKQWNCTVEAPISINICIND